MVLKFHKLEYHKKISKFFKVYIFKKLEFFELKFHDKLEFQKNSRSLHIFKKTINC